jgi:predicted DNA-binding transcriptional regulator AlpA
MSRIMTNETYNPNRLFTAREVESIYGISRSFLERRRREGGGPRFFKSGPGRTAIVRYRKKDIEEWIEKLLRGSSSE